LLTFDTSRYNDAAVVIVRNWHVNWWDGMQSQCYFCHCNKWVLFY